MFEDEVKIEAEVETGYPSQARDDSTQHDKTLLKKYPYNKAFPSCHPEERRISKRAIVWDHSQARDDSLII